MLPPPHSRERSFSPPSEGGVGGGDDLIDLTIAAPSVLGTRFDSPLNVGVREARLLNDSPWARTLGSLVPTVRVEGWKFPTPVGDAPAPLAGPPGGTPIS